MHNMMLIIYLYLITDKAWDFARGVPSYHTEYIRSSAVYPYDMDSWDGRCPGGARNCSNMLLYGEYDLFSHGYLSEYIRSSVVYTYEVNHTRWVAVVTPTDCPKSIHNRCVIELFCGVVCVVILPFWHFCWCRGFCHRTESDLFLFLF